MSLESAKSLGYKGSLLMVIAPIVMGAVAVAFVLSLFSSIFSTVSGGALGVASLSFVILALVVVIVVFAVVAFVGYVLFMVAMHRLSNYYSERGIFSNLLWALVIQLVGGAAAIVIYIALLFSSVVSSIGSIGTTSPNVTSILSSFIVGYIVLIVIAFAIQVVGGVLYWRAFTKLSEKSGVDSFRTAGLLFLIGAIIPFLGIISWIGWILAAMGYRKLAPNATTTYTTPPMTVPITGATKRCPNCGAENSADALYCRNCGKQL